jgi:hypothetical protein
MIEDKYIELINKKIDGLLTRDEDIRLEKYFSRTPEALTLYNDLSKVSTMLSQVTEIDPPTNLKKNVLNALSVNKYLPKSKRSLVKILIPSWKFSFKYAFVFTTGVILGVFTTFIFRSHELNTVDATGALIISKPAESFREISRHEIAGRDVSGVLVLKSAEELLLAQVTVTSKQPAVVKLDYDFRELAFQGLGGVDDNGLRITVSENEVQLSHLGAHGYFLVFKKRIPVSTFLSVSVMTGKNVEFQQHIAIE